MSSATPAHTSDSRLAVPAGAGVYLIDTLYHRPGLAASHLVIDDGRAAFVDTGAAPCRTRLLAALDELSIAREQVDYLFPDARAPRSCGRRRPADAGAAERRKPCCTRAARRT